MLLDGGAQFVHYLLDNVNYFIADNPDHPKVSEACEIYEKPVVTVSSLQSYLIFSSLIIFIKYRVDGFGFVQRHQLFYRMHFHFYYQSDVIFVHFQL